MTPPPTLSPAALPAIHTREQLEAVLENIAHLHLARNELRRAQEDEIAAIRQRYRAPLAEMSQYLELETSWTEAWAHQHPESFVAGRSLVSAHATIGFCATAPRIERASRRWTWSRIAATLGELAWGKRYLRVPAPEVDKEALVADLASLSAEDLRSAGMIVVQGEQFFLTPHSEPQNASAHEPAWQEAA
jgi:phage host-nuclease inhibitor protein Gam